MFQPFSALDPYIIVRNESEKVQSPTYKDNRAPVLDFQATFYRTKPAVPIVLEVRFSLDSSSEL